MATSEFFKKDYKKISSLAGLEPATFRFEVERVIHYAIGPPCH